MYVCMCVYACITVCIFSGRHLLPADHGLVQLHLLSHDPLTHRVHRHRLGLWYK